MSRKAQLYDRSDSIPQSRFRALTSTVGLLDPEVRHVLDDFAFFTHPSARAAFADKWISLAASRFEATWQVLYQLFKLVETEQLYASPDLLHTHEPFPTFQAYWEARSGKSFETWLDLEQTYAYVCAFKPALIQGLYVTAQKAAKKAAVAKENQAADEIAKHVGPKHKHIADNYTNEKDIIIRVDDNQGTSRTYALRRLEKERPDLHTQCLAGELTAHAAMVQAGFRKVRPSRKLTPFEALLRAWQRVSLEEQARFVRERLTEDVRRLAWPQDADASPPPPGRISAEPSRAC